jgi:hypothetical protein
LKTVFVASACGRRAAALGVNAAGKRFYADMAMAAKMPVMAAPDAGIVHDRRGVERVFDPRLIPGCPVRVGARCFRGYFN